MLDSESRPVGVFDSGIGGLSVVLEIQRRLPCEDIVYLADSQHCPYGSRTADEIRELTTYAAAFLVQQGCKLVVIACNTASAVSLTHLRQTYTVPIVGLEPALKPAVQTTRNGRVGVLATEMTLRGRPLRDLQQRFGEGIKITALPCPGLVEEIETGNAFGPVIEGLLRPCVSAMREAGIDTLVLGCTHYPLVRTVIAELMGNDVAIIDSGAAVARQVQRVLQQESALRSGSRSGKVQIFTTGNPQQFASSAGQLVDLRSSVEAVTWQDGKWQRSRQKADLSGSGFVPA